MAERPPWAADVADIIDPDRWSRTPFKEEWAFQDATRGLDFVTRGEGRSQPFNVRIERDINAGYMCVEIDGSTDDAAGAIRRCYAAALVTTGDTEGALRVLGGGLSE